MFYIRFFLLLILLGLFVFHGDALQQQQVTKPTYELKVGARNSTIRNIGSFQADSALIFPKRKVEDTMNSKSLKKKGAFFYDSSTHVVWFYDGTRFRTISSSGGSNIYTKSDSIKEKRTVTVAADKGGILKFVKGRVELDTLFLRGAHKKENWDSVLVVKNDTIAKMALVKAIGGVNIYNSDSSLKGERKVTMQGHALHFDGGDLHVDTIFVHKPIKGLSTDSFLTRFKDTVRYVTSDSLPNIYTKSDSIKEERIVTIKARQNSNNNAVLKFKGGRVEIDTLLVRKRRLGLSTDTLMVTFKDTVRRLPMDSLWNIYTKDDSIRNTKNSGGKRTVYLQSKKLVFALGKNNGTTNQNDTGNIGIGQTNPRYTLDIATPSFLANNNTTNNPFKDSIAVRISHVVTEGSGSTNNDSKAKASYGLVITENSNKAFGRSALGFQNGGNGTNSSSPFMKARLWTQVGSSATDPKFGIDVADSTKVLHTRMVINKNGFIGIDTVVPDAKLHILGKGRSFSEGIVNIRNQNQDNYLRIQAGGTTANKGGIWFTEQGNKYGWALFNNAANDKFQLVKTEASTTNTSSDTILSINRNGATVLNTQTGGSGNDSVALWIKHNTEDNKRSYGLMLDEGSNKANGRSAIGFRGGNGFTYTNGNNYVKSAIWAEVGSNLTAPKFGIDVADSNKRLHTRMVIDNKGRVGLGINTPTERLHIRKSIQNGTEKAANLIRIEAPGTGGNASTQPKKNYDHLAGIWLTENENNFGWALIFNAHNEGKPVNAGMDSYTNQVTDGNYLSIDYTYKGINGDDYIKATNRAENNKTHSKPAIRISSGESRSSSVIIAPYEGTGNEAIVFRVHGKAIGKQWTTWSDSILKRDVRGIVGLSGRDLINRLRPVTYYMRGDSSSNPNLNYGFIAQEVEKVMPDIVYSSKFRIFKDQPRSMPDSIKSMEYQAIIAPLVANVQLLNQESKFIKTRWQSTQQELQQELQKLKDRLVNLEYREDDERKGSQYNGSPTTGSWKTRYQLLEQELIQEIELRKNLELRLERLEQLLLRQERGETQLAK